MTDFTQEQRPTPLSQRCTALLSDGLHLTFTSETSGFSLTDAEAWNLLEYLYQHRDELYQATHQKPEALPEWAQPEAGE